MNMLDKTNRVNKENGYVISSWLLSLLQRVYLQILDFNGVFTALG